MSYNAVIEDAMYRIKEVLEEHDIDETQMEEIGDVLAELARESYNKGYEDGREDR